MKQDLFTHLGDILAWIGMLSIYAGILFFLGAAIWQGVRGVRERKRGQQ